MARDGTVNGALRGEGRVIDAFERDPVVLRVIFDPSGGAQGGRHALAVVNTVTLEHEPIAFPHPWYLESEAVSSVGVCFGGGVKEKIK